jgi:hypothetical protein
VAPPDGGSAAQLGSRIFCVRIFCVQFGTAMYAAPPFCASQGGGIGGGARWPAPLGRARAGAGGKDKLDLRVAKRNVHLCGARSRLRPHAIAASGSG